MIESRLRALHRHKRRVKNERDIYWKKPDADLPDVGKAPLLLCRRCELDTQLVGSGGFDVALTNYILLNVKPGHKVIDFGANVGYFTVLMGLLVGEQGKVLAYEAGRKNYGLLRDNVAMNMLFAKNRVMALQKAVSDTSGFKTFYYSELYTGSSTLVKPGEQYFDYFANDVMQEEEVMTETLDANEGNFDYMDLIKMDIEGGEYHAFLGMEALLVRQAVGKVALELNPLMLRGLWDVSLLVGYVSRALRCPVL